MHERSFGVTRACGLVGISRSLFAYRSRRPPATGLLERLKELAAEKRRHGYRRLHVLLRRDGYAINRKRTYRLNRDAGLTVRRRKRKRYAIGDRRPLPRPEAPNRSWSVDFVADGLADDRKLRCLAIVDDYTRECLAIEVDTSLTDQRVVAVLEHLADSRGLPRSITGDHGPEFEGQKLDAWAYDARVQLAFMRPGKPVENAYIESFNGRFRDECLNEHSLVTMAQARRVIERWRIEYSEERPHSLLRYLTPVRHAAELGTTTEDKVPLTTDSNPGRDYNGEQVTISLHGSTGINLA